MALSLALSLALGVTTVLKGDIAAHKAWMLRAYAIGMGAGTQVFTHLPWFVLVGQPTGGNQRGITGGAFFFLRLPNSKIEVDVPLIGQYPATEQPDGGLLDKLVKRKLARRAVYKDGKPVGAPVDYDDHGKLIKKVEHKHEEEKEEKKDESPIGKLKKKILGD